MCSSRFFLANNFKQPNLSLFVFSIDLGIHMEKYMNYWDNTSYNGKARQPLTLRAWRVGQGGTTVIVF